MLAARTRYNLFNCAKLSPLSVASSCKHDHDITNRNLIQLNQRRFIRKWRRALPFPPELKQHHLILPSLKEWLAEHEASTNPVKMVNIGMSREDFLKRIKLEEAKLIENVQLRSERRERLTAKKLTIESPDDLINLISVEKKRKVLKYDLLSGEWQLSDGGKESIIELAHHYQIYRDLFCSPSLVPYEELTRLPKVELPQFAPADDVEHKEVLQKWFPGSQPMKPPEPRPIYYFEPHVPIYAEFAVPESKVVAEDDDYQVEKPDPAALITTPVYRGNLIHPLYASERPNLVIDARVNTKEKIGSYYEEVDLNGIKLITNSESKSVGHYTVALFNLDSVFGDDKPLCHWLISNVTKNKKGKVTSDEVIKFMPTFGFRGFGYHRYVFVVYHHKDKLKLDKVDDFLLASRKLDPLNLGQTEDRKPTPVGLSWFQTKWDSYSNKVFHNVLNMRSPHYEYIQEKESKLEQELYPWCAPFNLYLDHYRDPKEMAAEALVERLKNVDPFNYKNAFYVDPLPNAPFLPKHLPSWQWAGHWKKVNRLGVWRNLRPASVYNRNNNNADLDKPLWPPQNIGHSMMRYPDSKRRRPKPLSETKWTLPPNMHPTYRIAHDHPDFPEDCQKSKSETD